MKSNYFKFKNKVKSSLTLLGAFTLIVSFQNCSIDSFQAKLPSKLDQAANDQLDMPSEDFNDDDLFGMDDIFNIPQSDNVSSSTGPSADETNSNLVTAATVLAKVYYVATNGSDNYTGTISKPFKTIQRAVKIVRPGDTVLIRKGRHAPFNLVNINGAAGRPITFKGELGAIVDRYLGGPNRYRNIEFYGGSYITIDGLELTDTDPVPPGRTCKTNDSFKNGIKFNKGSTAYPHYVVIKNMRIHDLRGQGMLGSSNYLQVLNNHIYDNGGRKKGWVNQAYGTYLKGKGLLIRGNRIHGNNGNGIRTGNSPEVGTSELLVDSIIENNLVYDNYGTILHRGDGTECNLITGGDGIVVWHGSGNIIGNNVVYNNGSFGIRINENFALNTKPNLVYNNTVYKNKSIGLYTYVGEKTVFKNNISYLNAKGNLFQDIKFQSNNLTIDPKFVNVVALDFQVKSASPAIDKGVTLKEVPKDFRGIARPRGKAFDIGAYEY